MPILSASRDTFAQAAATVFPSGDTSGTIDTATIQAAINRTATGGTLFLAPGTFYAKQTLAVPHQMAIIGLSGAAGNLNTSGVSPESHVDLQAATGLTGYLLSVAPVTLEHHFQLENIGIDLTNVPAASGLFLQNLDNSLVRGVKVRDGVTGIEYANVQQVWTDKTMCFNQHTRGFYSSDAANVSLKFSRCLYEQTQGATWGATAGFEFAAGASFLLEGVESMRSTAVLTNTLNYGILVTSAATTTFLFLDSVWCDAMTDGTGANSATSAAMSLVSSVNVRCTGSFFSANHSNAQRQRALRINAGADIHFSNCTMSGSGVEFATGNADRTTFDACNWPQSFSDPAFTFTGGSAPTNVVVAPTCQLGVPASNWASKADAAQFNTSTNGRNTGDY